MVFEPGFARYLTATLTFTQTSVNDVLGCFWKTRETENLWRTDVASVLVNLAAATAVVVRVAVVFVESCNQVLLLIACLANASSHIRGVYQLGNLIFNL